MHSLTYKILWKTWCHIISWFCPISFACFLLRWVIRFCFNLKLFSQILQANGFSPVCFLMWAVSRNNLRKPAPQISQKWRFSPVCLNSCILKDDGSLKPRPQVPQTKGVLLECTWFLCLIRPVDLANKRPQTSQMNGRSVEWTARWFLKYFLDLKVFPQTLHM